MNRPEGPVAGKNRKSVRAHRVLRIGCAILCMIAAGAAAARAPAVAAGSSDPEVPVRFGRVVALGRYVRLVSGDRSLPPDTTVTLRLSHVRDLRIVFDRDSLDAKDGPQFLKVTTVSTAIDGKVLDENVQYAITFRRLQDPSADVAQLERFVGQVNPMGYYNAELVEAVPIQVDSLGPWGWLTVRIEPESELVKYYGRVRNRLEFKVRVKGGRFQTGISLSVPKVLYDTSEDDSVAYGNSSAMFRIYALHGRTGERYPVDVGIGTFGVNSPIDVSKKGGGFAVSLYFDVIQMMRILKLRLPYKVSAGFDVSPFFPVGHRSRILFSARLGFTP
jgi:hypothetical protein